MSSSSSPSSSSSTYKHLSDAASYQSLISSYDVWLFDCDGVLWSGDDIIPGAKSVLEKLRQKGKKVVFVTNNASKSRKAYLKKFEKLGIYATEEEIFSSSYASALYLKEVLDFPVDRKVYVIGMAGIEEELDAVGIQHCGGTAEEDNRFLPALDFSSLQSEDALDPSVGAVMCGFDMHMSYIKLAKAHKFLTRPGSDYTTQSGAASNAATAVKSGVKGGPCHFILTNDDSTFPAKGGPWPGAGSLSAPLLFSTKRKPTIIGKPNQPMLDAILKHMHFDRSKAIFVGDRLDTDIDFAINGNIASLMVLTGISKLEEIQGKDKKTVPDYVVDSLGDLDVVE